MDDHIKKINELSNRLTTHDEKTKTIIKTILKKYPELKNFVFKTQYMAIYKGSLLKCISNDLTTQREGYVSSIKYYPYKKEETKIINTIVLTSPDKKWFKIYAKNYYLFANETPDDEKTKLIKKALREQKDIDNDDIFENKLKTKEEIDAYRNFLDQADEYIKNQTTK